MTLELAGLKVSASLTFEPMLTPTLFTLKSMKRNFLVENVMFVLMIKNPNGRTNSNVVINVDSMITVKNDHNHL
jgi:hypothetical protein